MRSMIINPLEYVIKITGDFVSAMIESCLANWVVACAYAPKIDALGDTMLDAFDKSMSLPEISKRGECISSLILFMGKISLMRNSMYVVQSKMSTAPFWNTQKHMCTLKVPIFAISRVIYCTSIESFAVAQSLGGSKKSYISNAASGKRR